MVTEGVRDLLDLRSLRRDRGFLDLALLAELLVTLVTLDSGTPELPSRDLGLDSMNCRRLSRSSPPR